MLNVVAVIDLDHQYRLFRSLLLTKLSIIATDMVS